MHKNTYEMQKNNQKDKQEKKILILRSNHNKSFSLHIYKHYTKIMIKSSL